MSKFHCLSSFSEALFNFSQTNEIQIFKHVCHIEPVNYKTSWYHVKQEIYNTTDTFIRNRLLVPEFGKSVSFRRLKSKDHAYATAVAPDSFRIVRNSFPQSLGKLTHNLLYGSNDTRCNLHQDFPERGFAILAVIHGSKQMHAFYDDYHLDIAKSLGIRGAIPNNEIYISSFTSPHVHVITLNPGEAVLIPARVWHQIKNIGEQTIAYADVFDYDNARTVSILSEYSESKVFHHN